jgi:arachidonate 15-lipoxygenase
MHTVNFLLVTMTRNLALTVYILLAKRQSGFFIDTDEYFQHLTLTHLLMEPFGIAFKRNLHAEHPIHRLLRPHFKGTILINRLGIQILIAEDSGVDRVLMSPIKQMAPVIDRRIQTVRFNDLFLRKNLTDRGVMSDKLDYPYRDYALPLWDAIYAFVTSVIDEHYVNDDAVVGDVELQAFADELISWPIGLKGFGDSEYLTGGTPTVITTKAYLIEMLTMVIFTSSCQHSALNFAQKPFLSYTPAFPLSMKQPDLPGTGADEASQESWSRWFPSLDDCSQQWSTNQFLGEVKHTSLGKYPSELTKGHSILQKSLNSFQMTLEDIGKMIDEKEANEKVPYLVLHPKQIPASINI